MLSILWQLSTGIVGLTADLLSLRDQFQRGRASIATEPNVVSELQIVEIYVHGHCNSLGFSGCGIGLLPPQLAFIGHCQRWTVALPQNANAVIYLRGHCNTICIPRDLRSRVHASVGGHCNEVV